MENVKRRVLGRVSAFAPVLMLVCALALALTASAAPAWADTSSDEAEEYTMIDFFEWILENEDLDSGQQADIEQAIAWLDGSDDKVDWYEEFVEIGVGSTSLEGILSGASYRATMNSIREVNGLNDLEINVSAMASAALNYYYPSGLGILSHSTDYGIGQERIAS